MVKELLTPDTIYAASIIGIWVMAFTQKQRQAIMERDNFQSQMRHYSEEEGWHTGGYCEDGGVSCTHLQVHHIQPQGTNDGTLNLDVPENGITLFECEHSGRCPENKIKPEFRR